jgi:RNA polymerase sigma-70 factor (ECF subfamily)
MTSQEPQDLELLAAWQSGDVAAGTLLFRRHYPAITRFFRRRAGEDWQDLVQSTFVGCIEMVARRRVESFRGSLFGIAWNKLRMHLRDRPRPTEPLPELLDLASPTLRTVLAAKQDVARLRVALAQLALDRQVMLELHHYECMSVAEIADVFGRPANTIKTQLRRARIELEAALAQA